MSHGRGSFGDPSSGRAVIFALFILLLAVRAGGEGLADGSTCYVHTECSSTSFCKIGECLTSEGGDFICGKCAACEHCRCASQAIDNACPARCAGTSAHLDESIQGRYISKEITTLSRRYGDEETESGADVLAAVRAGHCFRVWQFEGSTFSEQVVRKAPPLFPLPNASTYVEDAACAPGMAGGVFSVARGSASATLALTYTWASGAPRAGVSFALATETCRGVELLWVDAPPEPEPWQGGAPPSAARLLGGGLKLIELSGGASAASAGARAVAALTGTYDGWLRWARRRCKVSLQLTPPPAPPPY